MKQLMSWKEKVLSNSINSQEIKEVNSIFEQPWWLDAVCKDEWDAIVLKKGDRTYARMPFYKTKSYGCKLLTLPPETQTLGIYIEDTGAKLCKKLEKNKKIINEIIENLPKGYNVDFYLDPKFDYFIPFSWAGFKVTPRITYQFNDLTNLDEIFKGFKENIKTDIRKAEKQVEVRDDLPIEVLYEMQKKTFERQNRKPPQSLDVFMRIDEAAKAHNARKLLAAVDSDGCVHAAAYFIYDENRCYYLIGGGDPEYRNSGAGALLVWEGIKFASTVSKTFDFEGSVIEEIERFFRAFGANPKTYYHVSKYNWGYSILMRIKPTIKKMLHYR